MRQLARQVEPEFSGEWECMECGAIKAGVKARRPLACSECGAPASALEFFASGDGDGGWDSEAPLADGLEAEIEEEDES